jgi:nicotinamidase-related amidase
VRVEVPGYELHEEVRVGPAKTALIIVDMQNDFVKEGGALLVPDAEATIPKIKGLLDLAREAGMKVVYTKTRTTRGTRSGRSGRSTSGSARGAGRSSTSSSRARTRS